MNIQEIIEQEKRNKNSIYFFTEGDETFVSYELSAYLLTRLYPSIKLGKKYFSEHGVLSVAYFTYEFCSQNFTAGNILIGNEGVQVILDDSPLCKQWVQEFKGGKQSLIIGDDCHSK